MKRTRLLPPLALVLGCLLCASSATSRAEVPLGQHPLPEPRPVTVSALPGGQVKLFFEPLAPHPPLEVLRVEEVRALLTALHDSLPPQDQTELRLALASLAPPHGEPPEWELRLRQVYQSHFGPSLLPLPGSLENSPLFQALKLSPRYMGEGVREAARELFSSPLFLASVTLSVLVYFAAWLAPEPLFTKTFAATLTVVVALVVGVVELTRVALACVRLYQQAQAATTQRELEAVAERFGKAMGGTALRVLVLVASLGMGKGLPQVPQGGLRALLPSRFALPGGMTLEVATTVRMVADGTVIVTGVAAGTAASAVGSACTDGSEPKAGHHWHHLATNKNDTSTLNGGPWTPRFEHLFEMAEMTLDAAENLVYLKGHKGPHPEEYHEEVYKKLSGAVQRCATVFHCKRKLIEALRELAGDVCTPGSRLHQLTTKSQD